METPLFILGAGLNGAVLGSATLFLDHTQQLAKIPANVFWMALLTGVILGVYAAKHGLRQLSLRWTEVPPAMVTEAYFLLGPRGRKQLSQWQRDGGPLLFRDLRRLRKMD